MRVQKTNRLMDENSLEIRGGKSRSGRKRHSILKTFIFLLLFAMALIFIALSPLFNVKNIEVTGNNHCKAEDIIDTTGIESGINSFKMMSGSVKGIFLLRFADAERKLQKSFPYIKDVRVGLQIPDRIKIRVTERTPVGAVEFLGNYVVIDREGYLLETVRVLPAETLPVIKGLSFESYTLGKEIRSRNQEKFKALDKIMQAIQESDEILEPKIMASVNAIDISEPKAVKVEVNSRLTVNFGDLRDMDYFMPLFKDIYTKNLKDSKGYLDLASQPYPHLEP